MAKRDYYDVLGIQKNASDAEIKNNIENVSEKYDHQNEVNQLIIAVLDFNEIEFNNVFFKAQFNLGLEDAFMKVIIPFLQKIGMLWTSDRIDPANEHFGTNLIKQKLFAEINSLDTPPKNDVNNSFLLFLPTRNYHDLILIFCLYILKNNGVKTVYLGSDVPVESVLQTINKVKPKYLLTSVLNQEKESLNENYLKTIFTTFPKQKTIIGNAPNNIVKLFKTNKNVSFVNDIDSIYNYL